MFKVFSLFEERSWSNSIEEMEEEWVIVNFHKHSRDDATRCEICNAPIINEITLENKKTGQQLSVAKDCAMNILIEGCLRYDKYEMRIRNFSDMINQKYGYDS